MTFNLSWTTPTKLQANALDMNTNYLREGSAKNGVVLKGHAFENLDEVKLCTTREEIFVDHHGISIYNSFKKALKEGHTSYTFTLKKEDIDLFIEQDIKGFYIGLTPNGTGMWRMSDACNVSITKYKEGYGPLFNESNSTSWININKPCFIGADTNISEGCFSAYYFFDDSMYDSLHNKNVENITVRILFSDIVKPINGTYQLCYHNYVDVDDIQENFVKKQNMLGTIRLKDFEADHYDMILSRNQINLLKESKGISICSKKNDGFAISLDKIILFIDYDEIENENYYEREFNNTSFKSFVRETKTVYEDMFICGDNPEELLYMPFAFIGDNFKHFINNERVASVEIEIKTASTTNIDGNHTSNNAWYVDFYCHNVSSNKANYELYKYTDYLFTIDLNSSKVSTIRLNDKQFEILKNNVGLGAVIRNNQNNIAFLIEDIKVKVTYIK